MIDGELVVLDQAGRPSFSLLQNHSSGSATVYYFVFDLIVLAGEDVIGEPLNRRRELLLSRVLPTLKEPIRHSPVLEAGLNDLVASVKAQAFEGLVAKRRDSVYEIGQRTGAWQKMRINRGQEFVIGGYTLGGNTFEALVFGYYEGGQLIYVARTRNGFTPALRQNLMTKFRRLEIDASPFANLPEAKGGRWGQGLTEPRWRIVGGSGRSWSDSSNSPNGHPTTTSVIRVSWRCAMIGIRGMCAAKVDKPGAIPLYEPGRQVKRLL